MQISSVASKSVSAPLGEGERNFVQSTTAEPSAAAQKTKVNPKVDEASVTSNASVSVKEPSQDQVDKALKQVNDAFAQKEQNLLATVEKDKDTGINVLKVTDKDTKELVRQFPAETVIAMAQAIGQSLDAKGQLIHVKA